MRSAVCLESRRQQVAQQRNPTPRTSSCAFSNDSPSIARCSTAMSLSAVDAVPSSTSALVRRSSGPCSTRTCSDLQQPAAKSEKPSANFVFVQQNV